MDGTTFDRLTRRFGAATTRRTGLRAAFAASLGLLVPGAAGAAPKPAACIPNGQRCGKASKRDGDPCRKCCSRNTIGTNRSRRCACKPNGSVCADPSQCCGGICGAASDGQARCAGSGRTVATTAACSVAAGDVCADPDAACQPYQGGAAATYCLLPNQQACDGNAECVSSECDEGTCCGIPNQTCTSKADCCGNLLCRGGTCQEPPICDVTSCDGCCAAEGVCVPYAQQNTAVCGAEAAQCIQCGTGQVCAAGIGCVGS